MRLLTIVAVVALLTAPAIAGTIFTDDFNSENGGTGALNYNGFANWDVTDGTVDLIGNGYFDYQPGYGLYVDMDGSTGNAGVMNIKTSFNLLGGVSYRLSFDLAGNHNNNAPEWVNVQVAVGNLLDRQYSLQQNDPFQTFSEVFTPLADGAYTLTFEGVGGDNIGMLLDNVMLEAGIGVSAVVPLPATGWLGLGLLCLLGFLRSRR